MNYRLFKKYPILFPTIVIGIILVGIFVVVKLISTDWQDLSEAKSLARYPSASSYNVATKGTSGFGHEANIEFVTNDSEEDILKFYMIELKQHGWQLGEIKKNQLINNGSNIVGFTAQKSKDGQTYRSILGVSSFLGQQRKNVIMIIDHK